MNNKFKISIAIPTYNRASFLENLLGCILPQAKETGGLVQICISNNCSTDNTQEVVANFQKKYPGLINYSENKSNLGVDKNIIKVMEMSSGDFIWLLGDDDMIIDDGIKKVIDFIKNFCNKNTGLIILGQDPCFVGWKTEKETVCSSSIEKNNSEIYKMNRKDVIGLNFPNKAFGSVLLFSNDFLNKILREEKEIIEKAVGNYYIHVFLHRLMFLKYSKLEAVRFLKDIIISEEVHYYKFYIEDKFKLSYVGPRKLDDLLLSCKYMRDDYRKMIIHNQKGGTKYFIVEMGLMKSFKTLNYLSFLGCIKMFFQNTAPTIALLFSISFILFLIIPSVILKNIYKIFIRIRHKNWQRTWLNITTTHSEMSKGNRRLTC